MHIQAVLLDIDGTVMTGMEPIPGSKETLTYLKEHHIPYRFISNGTRKSRENVLKKLERIGVPISIDEIYTPAIAAIEYLKMKKIFSCNLLVTADLLTDFAKGGINHDPNAPNVVVGDAGDQFCYNSMNSAFRSLLQGGDLIALEKDRYWKDTDGLSLSAGPFISALEYATGSTSILMGKPSPLFFSAALTGFNIKKNRAVMIGDDIMSDVKGAQDAGMIGVITCTGKISAEDIDSAPVNPDAVISSIADLPKFLDAMEERNKIPKVR